MNWLMFGAGANIFATAFDLIYFFKFFAEGDLIGASMCLFLASACYSCASFLIGYAEGIKERERESDRFRAKFSGRNI